MSASTITPSQNTKTLHNYLNGLISGENGTTLLKKYKILELSFSPMEVMLAIDRVFEQEVDMERLKIASNKLFNILFKQLSEQEKTEYADGSAMEYLIRDNAGIRKLLAETRSNIKQINKNVDPETIALLLEDFRKIQSFTEHYVVMQNIVFPEIERQIEQHNCLKLMWAFHDDIVSNIAKTIAVLEEKEFDLALFNRLSSQLYFNISTIAFREENILFPLMHEALLPEVYAGMLAQLNDFHLAFADTSGIQAEKASISVDSEPEHTQDIKLSTGVLSVEQLELIFNHLPVDVTFVDEHDRVKFFSSPRHRIFPRTKGIIGRKVQNCHPHESLHVVNRIVEAFKKGEKDEASFWIPMGPKFVLIRYYAMRDENKAYRGVLEVSQEVSDIRKLEGERRLLDW